MISFLPIPGGFFSLATRLLSPAIVVAIVSSLTCRDLHVDGHTGLLMPLASPPNSWHVKT